MGKKKLKGQLSFFDYTESEFIENKAKNFAECITCWCYDCKHNYYNEGVPRDLCGNKIPCPACDECIKQEKANVCEIGSSKHGCSLRSEEEAGMLENGLY